LVPPVHYLPHIVAQQEPDPEILTPGPGAYSSIRSSFRSTSAPVAHAPFFSPPRKRTPQPLFARNAGRTAALSAGPGWSLPPSKQLVPGPGTYNISTAAATAAAADKAVHGVRSVGRSGPGATASIKAGSAAAAARAGLEAEEREAAAAGFGRTSKRFGDNSTVAPGPGEWALWGLA
jgi:hypothetical protein